MKRGGGRELSRQEPSDIDEAPEGERTGASESIESARGRKPRCPTKPAEILRRGRESNPRIAVLQTATLPLGYPADLRERTISLWRRLYQALSIERQVFAATTASAPGQRFNASANPIIVSACQSRPNYLLTHRNAFPAA